MSTRIGQEDIILIIPKTFQLAGIKWKVRPVKGLPELGRCDRDKSLILLQAELENKAKEVAFVHELIHAIKYHLGDGGPHDEKEVDAFAYLLHQYLITAK
jgi:hypothetical protein